mgnify:CR=1 FL=1
MNKIARFEIALFGVSMFFGASLLFAQGVIASKRRGSGDVTPVPSESYILTMAARRLPAAAEIRPAPALAAPVAQISSDSTRLAANLLVESVVQIESSGNPRTVGSHGERGLMQIKSGTWSDVTRRLFGSRVSFDRAFEGNLNRRVGAAYLADLQVFLANHRRYWKADERSLLLACYNAGPARVKAAGFDLRRLPAPTKDYVRRASALHDSYLADHDLSMSKLMLALGTATASAQGT